MIQQAVILCGGLGGRLGALTAETPKPLLLIGGVPFLDVLLFELARHGVTRVLLLAGFAAQRIVEYATTTPLKARFGLEIEVAIEPQRAGTGGAVWHARDHLDDRFFLLNGDSWFDINLLELASRVICEPSTSQHNGDLVWTQESLKIYSEAFIKTDPDGSLLLNFFTGGDSGPEG